MQVFDSHAITFKPIKAVAKENGIKKIDWWVESYGLLPRERWVLSPSVKLSVKCSQSQFTKRSTRESVPETPDHDA